MSLSSRERLLGAIAGDSVDYVPCSFMLFSAVQWPSMEPYAYVERQLELGIEPYVWIPNRKPNDQVDYAQLPGIAVCYDDSVEIRQWREIRKGVEYPLLCKEYQTPKGNLRVEVKKDTKWPYGDRVPFLDDFICSRVHKPLIERPEDLDALKYLLARPGREEIKAYSEEAAIGKAIADKHGLAVAGGWGVSGDMFAWLCGLTQMMFMGMDNPEMLGGILDIISEWNTQRAEVVLSSGVDLFIHRGWYETIDFWSPDAYRQYLLPILKADVELVHSHGARFGYINTSSNVPLLDCMVEAGVDVLMGVDPDVNEGKDMLAIKEKVGNRMAIWGGVNGDSTMEMGTPGQVEAAVEYAMDKLSPGGRFILSPVDNVRRNDESVMNNVRAFVETWKRLR